MKPLINLAILGAGAVLWWLIDRKKIEVTVLDDPQKEEKPTEEEMRKVMRHLGKRSGISRSKL